MHMLSLTRCPHALRLLSAAALLAGLLGNLGAAQPVQAASLTVTTTADELNSDGDCALREAVRAANLDIAVDACGRGSGADTIMLPAGTYTLSLDGTDEDAAATGDLDLSGTLTINGAGAAVIDGAALDRVFDVLAGANLTLSNLTLSNGRTSTGTGGAIRNRGTLTIVGSTIRDSAARGGDGPFEGGGGFGGGIANLGGQVALTNSVVRDNTAEPGEYDGPRGGGMYSNGGSITLNGSLIRGNTAYDGSGGVFVGGGTMLVTNSTIAENAGSGIENRGVTTVRSSTISGNRGTGVDSSPFYASSVTVANTLIASNVVGGRDCTGLITSEGYNLIRNSRDCTITGDTTGNLLNVSPLLGPLRDSGGPTPTHALLPGSPALDAGSPAMPGSGSACPATDQRGVARPQDGNSDGTARCDIGAQERQDTLVLNGGFEADSNGDGTPDAWSANARAMRSNAVVRSGTYALWHQATDNASYTVFSDPAGPIVAGRSYTVSGFVNIPATSDTFSLEVQMRWRDAGSTILSTVPVQTYSAATSGWSSFTATLVAPPNATQATLRQVLTSLNATLYVDDLLLRPVEDLVLNGGFEADGNADGTPDGWSANARAARSNAAAYGGTYALRHQATDNASYTVFSDPVVPIVAGQSYTFSGAVNIPPTSDAFGLELQVRWRDAGGNVLSTVPVQSYSAATGGWSSFSASLIAPANATQVTLRQAVTGLNATLYVDDLVFGP